MSSGVRSTKATPRIGDDERHCIADLLGDHLAHGRLTQEEFHERLGRALTAKTSGELGELVADLPVPREEPATGAVAARKSGSVSRLDRREIRYAAALAAVVTVTIGAAWIISEANAWRDSTDLLTLALAMLASELVGAIAAAVWMRTRARDRRPNLP
ncbi:DUF1707 domain-containing protein [Actinopolymorpha sp. B9G3]|uniref:DUF1707 SHOCT-like domain-containing protein n=1 Tax=Actinopolymorpha sp. B9G3 TaxID=3158970 RepID=UPI0032D94697